MKESYGEGLASHTGPESCAVVRKGDGEALTGVRAGRVLSREMPASGHSGVPTPWRQAEGHTDDRRQRETSRGPRAVGDPVHARKHLAREPGDPAVACGHGGAGRIGKSKDARR